MNTKDIARALKRLAASDTPLKRRNARKALDKAVRELQAQGGKLRAFVDRAPNKLGQEIHGVQVVAPEDAGRFQEDFHLAAVAQPGGREEIREDLRGLGLKEIEDFLAVA